MAACMRCLGNRSHVLENNVSLLLTHLRGSRYDSRFKEPEVDQEVLKSPLPKDDPRVFSPIKAMPSSRSIVLTYDPVVEKMTNMIMRKGNKVVAREQLEQAFEQIKRTQVEKYHKTLTEEEKALIELNPRRIFRQAVDNCKPILNLTKVRRGGTYYQVPYACSSNEQLFRALKWMIDSSKEKDKNVRFYRTLANEILDAYQHKGKTIKRKQDIYRQCEANKAYASYRVG